MSTCFGTDKSTLWYDWLYTISAKGKHWEILSSDSKASCTRNNKTSKSIQSIIRVQSTKKKVIFNKLKIDAKLKMAFILGVGSYSSDTRGPIWMKLWVCIELALKLCIVTFLTSGWDLKTGNWNFPENPTIIPCIIFLEISDFPATETFPNWF